jgi:hypothetical protein
MRHWAITFCWIIHRIRSHLSLFLLISFIPSSCHFSPRQVWKEAAVPGCDVLIPLVLIDGAQGKNPAWIGTLLLGKKTWTTPAHDTLMLCKIWKYFNSVRGREQIKRLNTSQRLSCITAFCKLNLENVAPGLFFDISDLGPFVCTVRT